MPHRRVVTGAGLVFSQRFTCGNSEFHFKHASETSQIELRLSKTEPIYCSNKNAGWSSLVARQAHNLKAVGSNPTPATTLK
jgi:hypothetical protein